VVFVEKGIDDVAAQALTDARLCAVAHVARTELEQLARASGARIVDRAADLTSQDLGSAGLVDERLVGEDHLTFVTGCPNPHSVTLLLRGGSQHVVDEVERSLVDAVSTVGLAVTEGTVVTGAGAAAVELSLRLRDLATGTGGRGQLAMQAFADALEVIPHTLAESAGMDPIDALLELRRRHAAGEVNAGVDVLNARIADLSEVAVEPLRVDLQVIEGATETAAMLLRIDTVVASKRSSPTGGSRGALPGAG
jgi:chaperonin GroEL (HSP60 family)